ncbi:hypothetical protein U9M48_031375 [Paspalum notatum var. saurae]|uniref:Uncharacterized protein n=1 Tax=Paspalum notatum var. saurae TaxID=547442 RepID=A0AAQ3U3V6_PASNO
MDHPGQAFDCMDDQGTCTRNQGKQGHDCYSMPCYRCNTVDKRPLRQSCAPMMQRQLATLSATMDARHCRGIPKRCASHLLKSSPRGVLNLQKIKPSWQKNLQTSPDTPCPLKRGSA